jgi:membrane associated rhomboid family serine protease
MVMPLWDASPLKLPKWPFVTWGLIAANVAVFIVTVAASPEIQAKLLAFAVTPALLTGDATAATGVSPYVTLVTYQFLHANLFHLLGNMIFLWVFGDDVEEAMGSVRFIAFYIGRGIAAALLFVASAPHSQEPLVGASGAVAAVLAAYLMFRPCQKVAVFLPWILLWVVVRPVVWLDAYWVLGGWMLVQVWQISVQTHDDVDYMAHVGGLAVGAVMFPFLRHRTVRLFECTRQPEKPADSVQIS